MERLPSVLVLCLLVAVLGVGLVVYVAAEQAADDREELACLQRVQTTATLALLTPEGNVDDAGRLAAIKTLGARVDGC